MDENEIGTIVVDCAVKLTNLKLGYLLNFGDELMKNGITRIINGRL
jgi:hypothetical protein